MLQLQLTNLDLHGATAKENNFTSGHIILFINHMKKLLTYFVIFCLIITKNLSGQENTNEKFVKNTFTATRIINGHSTENTPKGRLDLLIQHRMGRINDGFTNFFGLDQSTFRFGFEYGLNNWLMIGTGRSTVEKFYDVYSKCIITRQTKGDNKFPFNSSIYFNAGINSSPWQNPDRVNLFRSRLFYTTQIIISRKFNDYISLQLSPVLVHRNLVATETDNNDVFILSAAGRIKINYNIALSLEYYYIFPDQINSQFYNETISNCFSSGIEIFTGRHVFQIFISNSVAMNEKQFITETTDKWDKGQLHFGFNLIRFFKTN